MPEELGFCLWNESTMLSLLWTDRSAVAGMGDWQSMIRKGKAAVFVGPARPMEIREYPVVSPDDAGVLMQLVHSGICGTDIHILEGSLPIPPQFIPGHEFIGRVIETGPNARTDAASW